MPSSLAVSDAMTNLAFLASETGHRKKKIEDPVNPSLLFEQVMTSGDAKRLELHEKVQGMLRHHVIGSKARRRKQQQREALLARLHMDSELLTSE